MNSICHEVKLQCHKPAVSLFCRAALNCGECVLPWTVLQCTGAGSLHTCMKSISPVGVFAVTQARCEPILQSSTGRLGIHLILSRAAEHWCWVTADLYEEPIMIGAFAVTQACCQPVLQGSTGHWMHLILSSAPEHWC